ncbi:MAG: HAD-IA family hydrolase [Cyanobacteria bacterium J06627_28]
MSSALLFGSIGTLVDTSELQRQAFNQAFKKHKLDWQWSRADYTQMLKKSGGRQRIEDYAQKKGTAVDIQAIHRDKSEIFQQLMEATHIFPRQGVEDTITAAKREGVKLALVTTTSEKNVATLLSAISDRISPDIFDLIVDNSDVTVGKPSSAAYEFALEQLHQTADSCVAIEDNLDGVKAATASGIPCIAFPGENTAQHTFSRAEYKTNCLSFETMKPLLSKRDLPSAA